MVFGQRNVIRKVIEEKGNWYQLILKMYELDEGVRKTFFQNFIINSALKGTAIQQEIAKREYCNVPWAILLDPTSACNLHCTGCWAAQYGHKLNLNIGTIDDIIRQGKELGTYMYIYTGGEPLVRKKDIITLCECHSDCEFLAFTNGTLIDEDFCQEMLRVKNFVPAISLEGFEKANDGRRGEGVFNKVQNAMKLLKENKLPFGISVCYTSANYADISSEEFFDMLIEAGACLYGSFTICQLEMTRHLNFFQIRNNAEWFMKGYGAIEIQSRFLVWIFKMMPSMWADVLRGDEIIFLMRQEMWSRAYSFIIPMRIFMTALYWKR